MDNNQNTNSVVGTEQNKTKIGCFAALMIELAFELGAIALFAVYHINIEYS